MDNEVIHNQVTEAIVIWFKTFWYALAAFTFDYLNIPQDQLYILWVLMVIDTASGIAKAYRISPKSITSHELSIGVMKKIGELIFVYTLALIGKWIHIPPEHFIEWALSLLIMAEWYSIIQNIYAFRTWKIVAEFDAISMIIKKIGEFIRDKMEKLTTPKWN